MRETRIVTSFLNHNNKILILKRSNQVSSMKGLWSGISGIIENSELPIERAKQEIFEEVGINSEDIILIKSNNAITVQSSNYKNQQWVIYPFFFKTTKNKITLNWENSEFRWIDIKQLGEFNTVPKLEKVLFSVL